MDSLQGDSTFMLPGFPIRTSPGHSSFGNSPEHFAAYNVLLRLSAPRHPPCALHSLISIPLLQSLRALKSDGLSDSLESSIQTLDFLSKSLDLLALNIYRFLLFCCQRYVAHNALLSPIRPLPFGRTQQARRAYTRVGVRCQDFF